MRMLRAMALISSVAVVAGFTISCSPGISRRVIAFVISVRGEVTAAASDKSEFHPINRATKLAVGTIVKTSHDADVELRLLPGALVRMSEDSELRIDELKLTKDGNETEGDMLDHIARFEFRRGKALFDIEEAAGSVGHFAVLTDRVTINSKPGRLFQVETNDSTTRVTCVRGHISAWPRSDRTMVSMEEGDFHEWPVHPAPALVTEDGRARSDMEEAQKAAAELENADIEQLHYLPWEYNFAVRRPDR